jgi:hypothetical protein
MKKKETKSGKGKKDVGLKIHGTLDEVLKAAVKGNPKPALRKNKGAST